VDERGRTRERYVDEHGHGHLAGDRDHPGHEAEHGVAYDERRHGAGHDRAYERDRPRRGEHGLLGRLGLASRRRHAVDEPRRGDVGTGNTPAVVALILGIAAVGSLLVSLGGLFFLALPLGIAAIVFGAKGKRKADHELGGRQRGLAKVGLALGGIGTLVSLLAILLLLLGVSLLGNVLGGLNQDVDQDTRQDEQSQTQGQRDELARRAQRQREELARRAARQRQELRQRAGGGE
jgi:hypothetical protein